MGNNYLPFIIGSYIVTGIVMLYVLVSSTIKYRLKNKKYKKDK